MGMSSSQVRLLSLTSRMHDLEYQAQSIQYEKLAMANKEDEAYDVYLDATESTKLQMSILTADGKDYQDVTYTNLVNQATGALHTMYAVTNASGQILLPESITDKLSVKDEHGNVTKWNLDSLDDFLGVVADNYLYKSRTDLSTTEERIEQMKTDGNYSYWSAIYYQIAGCKDDNENLISARGFDTINDNKTSDRDWLMDGINDAEIFLYKLTNDTVEVNSNAVNIFEESQVSTDTELSEVSDDELIAAARTEYEHKIKELDTKESKLDMQLTQIDTEHNALKTEYDSVKQIVSKNIERSYKTFNA